MGRNPPRPPSPPRGRPKKARRPTPPGGSTLQAFDALILAMALDEAPGQERQVIEKWTAARTARNTLLFS